LTDAPGPDPTRRQFFRRFAGDVVTSAAQVVGAVTELRDRSAAEAAALLDPNAVQASAAAASTAETEPTTRPTGFRTPFRFESDNVLLVIDQRKLPDELVEVPVRSGSDAASAIRRMVVRGAPAIGQVAAIGLALTARIATRSNPHTRRAIIDGAASQLRTARPTAVNLPWAIDRLMARYHEIGDLSEDGEGIARALLDEAMAIVAEATDDHGRLAEAGRAILPETEGPLRILTHCNTGPLACGQFGTALGVVQAAHATERPLQVWVDETRPYLQGARLTAWELVRDGIETTVITDNMSGALMRQGKVDLVVVGADRIAANGDTANKVGTYPLAVLAARHGIPFLVAAPVSTIDLATATGDDIPIEERAPNEVLQFRGIRVAPPDTDVRNPAFDVTPAELITGVVTDEGVLRSPYDETLAEAVASRARRRAASPGPARPAASA
jgi:methylthioribose-1-phosphate isomerase